jgi:D-glycero-D-manno-heptose 1,7-bisphosphate phosphatase
MPKPVPSRPAVFVDKDGTLVENVPYNADPARLRFLPGAPEALAALAAAGFALVIVSNQSGLGMKLFTLAQFMDLCNALRQQLHTRSGVVLTDLLFCPHAPGPDRRPICACRKPQPWMITTAARAHGLDLAHSWMVGDTLDDVEAGHRAGCRALLLDSGGETEWREGPWRTPEQRLADWDAVARHILGDRGLRTEAARPAEHLDATRDAA